MTNFAGCPVLIVLLHLQHLVLSTKMFQKKHRENSLQNDPPGTRGSTEKSNRPGSGQLQLHWGQLRPGASSSKLQSHDHAHTSSWVPGEFWGRVGRDIRNTLVQDQKQRWGEFLLMLLQQFSNIGDALGFRDDLGSSSFIHGAGKQFSTFVPGSEYISVRHISRKIAVLDATLFDATFPPATLSADATFWRRISSWRHKPERELETPRFFIFFKWCHSSLLGGESVLCIAWKRYRLWLEIWLLPWIRFGPNHVKMVFPSAQKHVDIKFTIPVCMGAFA